MTGPIDNASQTLVNAAAIVESANTYLAFFNSEMDRAAGMISEVSPNGFVELHQGLEKAKRAAHELMALTFVVKTMIANKGGEIANLG